MPNRSRILLVIAGLALGGAARLGAQDQPVDARWRAFLGCWESTVALQWRCVVPAAGTSAVDLVTVTDGQIASRERIAATGERVTTERDGCLGWESAAWSALGPRLYLRAEAECAGGARRTTSGVIAMSPGGEWLYVESVKLGAGQAGIRLARYREASAGAPLPAELTAPVPGAGALWDRVRARVAAGAALTTNDVIEASRHLDGAVVEAWLAERGEAFAIDAKRLVTLADGGVDGRVIDLLVAMAYPEAFARHVGPRSDTAATPYGPGYGYDPQCDPAFDYPWSYGCGALGYGGLYGGRRYNGGWYPDGYPVIIVYQGGGGGGGGGGGRAHGRVVKGRGYQQGENTATGQGAPRSSSPSSGTGRSSSGSGGSSSGSSSGGEQRTAKPRPPN